MITIWHNGDGTWYVLINGDGYMHYYNEANAVDMRRHIIHSIKEGQFSIKDREFKFQS
jgi:hypothetical protein